MVTVLDSILVHFFYFQIIIGVKTHYFWSWYEKNYILILGKGVKQKFDDTTLTVGAKYSIKVIKSHTKFCSSLHYNESNRFLFVNATKIYQFKAKDSDIKKYPLRLGNVSGEFSTNSMKKKTGLNGYVKDFSVDCKVFDISDITNTLKYLMKKDHIK